MKTEIMIAVLALLCIGSLAAAFVLWAKLDEQKQKTKDEHDNYCVALRIGNSNAKMLGESQERERCSAQAVLWYSEKLKALKEDRNALQDKLSSLLCPHNDHVWEVSDAYRGEYRCKKCGRVEDV